MVPKRRILVVEDNELNRAMLCGFLQDEYDVLEAENGQQALDLLKTQREKISLILLDVMMPVMDGYTFLDRVRVDEELSLIPVIVMTQGSSEEDEVAALAHGATDFVPKPYRPQVILHRVASLIKLRENAAMINQFQFDRLTGVFSKEFFYQKAREWLDSNPEKEYSVLCTNIENFKLYNDAFGREAGDCLLKRTANILADQVGTNGLYGRYGADRFLCMIEREQDKQSREVLPQKLEYRSSGIPGSLLIRWGVYEIEDRSISVEQMCDRAQLAVDSIKGQYSLSYAVYDDALRGKLLREKAITDAMETALAEKQFSVYLQPKYSLKDDCMAGAEALVRWIHPEWGFMSPGEFIPLFEKNGFIYRLDAYVWEEVCALLARWKAEGKPLLPISVNVSRTDIYQGYFLDILQGLIRKYGIDPEYLHLEITESAYAENPAQIISTVEQLRKLGFPIEMDDFGSGYSSLNMLGQMKLDILKLDMKFVQNEIAKPADQSILNDIVVMAHRMRLAVVAEGVETREQVNRLLSMGCDYVQGYYFAKPMPIPGFETLWLSQRHSVRLPSTPEAPEMYSLLVVDEDPVYREKVRKAFEEKYKVYMAQDAQSALDCVRQQGNLAVVILSMTLPDGDANTFLRSLRQDMAKWRTPVLACIPGGSSLEPEMVAETDDFLCKYHPMFDLQRRVERLVDDVRARKREHMLQEEASRDYLTGLLNRRGLQAAMGAIRTADLPLAVYLFDLDNLKQANDIGGHDVGDQLLQSFAGILRRHTRMGDILCRYGGDEFVAILKHLGQREDALQKGNQICEAFQRNLTVLPVPPACSVGVSLCAVDERPSMDLIEYADQAMYRAKREKRGGCCLWDEIEKT